MLSWRSATLDFVLVVCQQHVEHFLSCAESKVVTAESWQQRTHGVVRLYTYPQIYFFKICIKFILKCISNFFKCIICNFHFSVLYFFLDTVHEYFEKIYCDDSELCKRILWDIFCSFCEKSHSISSWYAINSYLNFIWKYFPRKAN